MTIFDWIQMLCQPDGQFGVTGHTEVRLTSGKHEWEVLSAYTNSKGIVYVDIQKKGK